MSDVRVMPEGPKEPGDALRARSKMRGGRLFLVGASRLTRTSVFVVAPQAPNAGERPVMRLKSAKLKALR